MRPWPFSTVSARATSGGGSSQGGSVAEGDGDVAMQLRLVRLHDEQVVALSVTHMAADLALGEDRIAGGLSGILCAGPVDHHARMNLSSNMMANWVFASPHSWAGVAAENAARGLAGVN